jgi:hypothetical protein
MIVIRFSKFAACTLVVGLAAIGTLSHADQAKPVPGASASEAEQIAGRVLKAGSDLFDAKNASALASTYTDDGVVHLISKSEDQQFKDDTKRGRADIEQFYRDLFREAGPIDSENTVEFARLIAPDLLVVHGRFRPDKGQKELPFVQMRVKQGPEWLLKELWLFLSPGGE